MSEALPEFLDPRRAVVSEARFEGRIALVAFSRLAPLLTDHDGLVWYRLEFGRDARGFETVTGRIEATLPLSCQRCNGSLALDVVSDLSLALVEGLDQAAALPDSYDPLLLGDRLIRPSDLIEDELILAVPAVPRHADGDCRMPEAGADVRATGQSRSQARAGADGEETVRPNPFAALAQLKRNQSH
ncbi:hypothetical protein F2Q65_05845 [Thiohalocapsa marina]|uniref:Large ribosomal RNA subunit accumulation protein YceD n=1 Tax=Thiohalocapsa marina TaxID=424902 RepID=A0A5M8FN50_9GAMM|nr:YceD family protein [Thiohalocapsa marina]KAA6186318.1 hypothetical protein F2Q65_05845 [Thiohalocapsa marina]